MFDVICLYSTLQHEVMVTAGANQGFVNLTLTLLDANDGVVLFAPYYFNHMMAIQVSLACQCSPRENQFSVKTPLKQVSKMQFLIPPLLNPIANILMLVCLLLKI